MPFYFYKPVDSSAFTISDSVVTVPTLVQFFNCGHCFFTVLIDRFLVECHIAVVAAGFLWIVSITTDVFQNLPFGSATRIVNVSDCMTHLGVSSFLSSLCGRINGDRSFIEKLQALNSFLLHDFNSVIQQNWLVTVGIKSNMEHKGRVVIEHLLLMRMTK